MIFIHEHFQILPSLTDQSMSSQTISSQNEHISFSKIEKQPLDLPQYGEDIIADTQLGQSREVFQAHTDGVEFRNVSWQRASVVFVKINFAMSILSIPAAMAALGSVGGSLSLVGFTALNICECRGSVIGVARLTRGL